MRKIGLLLLFLLLLGPVAAKADLILIIHGATNVTSIDKKIIKDIFTGQKTVWDDNTKITFATLKEGDVHKQFLQEYVQKNPSQFQNFWRQKIFLGQASKLPMACETMEEMIEYVSKTPGSIGYMSSDKKVEGANIKEILMVK